MIKYFNSMVVFEEIPSEITLAINITNCPCHCKGCHSKFLWENIGVELTKDELCKLIDANDGITCVCFMGGDSDPEMIQVLAKYVLEQYDKIKVAWYSGMDELYENINLNLFNYIKIGHYDENAGPLNKETTNQKLYEVFSSGGKKIELKNITSKFWKHCS